MSFLIYNISQNLKVCALALFSICQIESGGRNVIHHNDGNSHSYGYCQVKLETAQMFNKEVVAEDLMNPQLNVYYAALYLKKQTERYSNNPECSIAAYNAGSCFRNEGGEIVNAKYVKKAKKIYRHFREGILFDQRYCLRDF